MLLLLKLVDFVNLLLGHLVSVQAVVVTVPIIYDRTLDWTLCALVSTDFDESAEFPAC